MAAPSERSWLVLVGAVAFAAYGRAVAPGAYLLDSAEFAAASFQMGVAHPPGEPVALLWGKLFSLLPIGGVAFRVGLSQALAGALAAALVLALAHRVYAALDVDRALGPTATAFLAAGAAFAFAFAPGAVIVADRPEVYALQTALSLGALLAAHEALVRRDGRWLLLAATLIGLGLGNHPLIAGLTGLGAVTAAFPFLAARVERPRLVLWSLVAFAVGALALAYLPARAHALLSAAAPDPDAMVWGDARSPAGLGWLLAAKTFVAKQAIVQTQARPWDLPFVLMEELEIALAVLAPFGAFWCFRRREARPTAIALLVGWLGSVLAAFTAGLDPSNPDIRGYLGPAIAITAIFSGAALAVGLPLVRAAMLRPALAALMLLGALTRFPGGGTYPGFRYAATAEVAMAHALDELPPRAVLLTANFESAFLLSYQRTVEGLRPDVSWAHLGFMRSPGYADRVGTGAPALSPVIGAQLAGRLERAPVALVNERHPVRIEPDENLGDSLRAHLVPEGRLWRLRTEGNQGGRAPAAWPTWMVEEAATDRQVRGFLGWRAYQAAGLACQADLATARWFFEELNHFLPSDRHANALAEKCRKFVVGP